MGIKGKVCVGLLLFVALFFISVNSFGLSVRDSEIRVCKLRCEQIQGGEEGDMRECKQRCEEYQKEKQKREREGGSGRRGGGGDEYDIVLADEEQEVKKMVEECHQSCQGSQGEQQRPQCFQTCMKKRFQEREKGQSQRGDTSRPQRAERTRRTDKQRRSNNPYVFEDHHFTARLDSQHGSVKVLQKFTDRSELFRGIEKYRVAFLEADPRTFIIPNHWDADALIFVAQGKGTITLIEGESRQSQNIKRGDLFRVPAGITAYLINRDNNEKLVLAKILRSVSVPGELQLFSVGTGNPESSFYNAFSTEVLEAAFDVDRDSIEKMMGQQKQEQEQGIFKKATQEQIESMTGEGKSRIWPFSESKEKGTHNIYKNEPSVANENGMLHEIDSNDFPELKNINVAFSFFNITQGSMAGPFYNTKATQVLMVPNGEGRFEMACPHLSEQSTRTYTTHKGQINPTYEKVSSQLRRGTVVVIPAGHPLVIEASGEQNLEVIGFGLNTDENEWFPLAGRDNVLSQWEDEAIELTFGFPAKEVQKVIQKQNQKLFFKGPARRGRDFA